jgi:hypothetical protein
MSDCYRLAFFLVPKLSLGTQFSAKLSFATLVLWSKNMPSTGWSLRRGSIYNDNSGAFFSAALHFLARPFSLSGHTENHSRNKREITENFAFSLLLFCIFNMLNIMKNFSRKDLNQSGK